MCDGQPTTDCEIINLTDYDAKLTEQLTKLDEQFDAINVELKAKKEIFIEMYRKDPRISYDEAVLSLHKIIQDFDPFNPPKIQGKKNVETIEESTQTVMLSVKVTSGNAVISESDKDVDQSSDRDSDTRVRQTPVETIDKPTNRQTIDKPTTNATLYNIYTYLFKFTDKYKFGSGYYFLNHPKIEKSFNGKNVLRWNVRVPKFNRYYHIGMVITNDYKNFDFLDITF